MDFPSYHQSESGEKPKEIEINNGSVFLRKQFQKIETLLEGEGSINTVWRFQEAILTVQEFEEYKNSLVLNSQTDQNQMILMDAIADLYMALLETM